MRGVVSACAAAVMLAAFTGPAHAAGEARIGGFEFSCRTPEGETVKPKFGDIPRATFNDLPAQREQCLKTIQRKIYGCSINTDFATKAEDERHAACLPIFEEQAQACADFYHKEKAKCDAGGTGAAAAGAASGPEPREGPLHEAHIGGFRFSCRTPEGETVKPKFGDIPSAFFNEMPAQREQCLETIQRKIHGCSINTDFGSNTRDERHAACLPVFEEQAQACAAYYREERAKCDAGSAEAGTPDPAADEAAGTEGREAPAADAALEPKCEGMAEGAFCWKRISGKQECRLLDDYYFSDQTVTWSGSCSGGIATGEGTLVWARGGKSHSMIGEIVDGKMHGHWVKRFADGGVQEGPYVDGKMHGHWVLRFADGQVEEGPVVDGKKHGHWVERWPDGRCGTFEMSAGEQIEGSWKDC